MDSYLFYDVLVKTSNPSSTEISDATNAHGEKIRDWLASYIHTIGKNCVGKYGYSNIGAVVGATFPEEAYLLRNIMKNNLFLVPGFGAQGGEAKDIVPCFNEDGLGAIKTKTIILVRHSGPRRTAGISNDKIPLSEVGRILAKAFCTIYHGWKR